MQDNNSLQQDIPVRNIALVVNSFDKGGLEQVVMNLYLGYRRKGWKAYILSQTRLVGSMAEKLLNLKDIYIFDGNEDDFFCFCRNHNIDVLHYHYNTFMLKEARERGFKILYTMHNAYTWMTLSEIRAYSARLASAHKVVPVSTFVEQYYLARTGAGCSNIQTIPNGVDFAELDGEYKGFSVSRENPGLSEQDIVICEIASFHPAKHQVGMIGVMERLQKDHPEIKLLLVGNEGDKSYYNYFMKTLANSPSRGNISVIPYFDHKYMGQFLRSVVDIFTLPTLYEGCSNAALEAAYCAKPMVLTNVGNADEMNDIASCEIVQTAYQNLTEVSPEELLDISLRKYSRNTEDLARAIVKIAADLDDYKVRAIKAVNQISQYDTDHMVRQYMDIVESIY